MPIAMTEVRCRCCGDLFRARTADVKRGWGKFCSKSCKAKKQDQRGGKYRAHCFAKEFGGKPQFDNRGEYEGFTMNPAELAGEE